MSTAFTLELRKSQWPAFIWCFYPKHNFTHSHRWQLVWPSGPICSLQNVDNLLHVLSSTCAFIYSLCLLVPKKCHQSKDFGGWRSLSLTSDLTAFDLQLGSNAASLQLSKRPRHRPWAAWSDCLIGPSVAHMQVVGVDVAESDANLLSGYSTAIADWPGLEAGEDLVQWLSRAKSFLFFPLLAHTFWSEPKSITFELASLKSVVHHGFFILQNKWK